ncbi:MAG: uracil phosphoribosyltransferase [Pseudomonadota bacterium]
MLVEVKHPCIQHKLALLRDTTTSHKKFRELATEVTMFLCYEALKHVATRDVSVTTPVGEAQCKVIANDVIAVPILRAGIGMLDGVLNLLPTARVGFMGLYRDPETKQPVQYYERLPPEAQDALHLVIDPMLATGGSASAALTAVKAAGVKNVVMICIVTCPEGAAVIERDHPDVPIYAAAVDERLDERKYIVPGLGDAGDRLYGTS